MNQPATVCIHVARTTPTGHIFIPHHLCSVPNKAMPEAALGSFLDKMPQQPPQQQLKQSLSKPVLPPLLFDDYISWYEISWLWYSAVMCLCPSEMQEEGTLWGTNLLEITLTLACQRSANHTASSIISSTIAVLLYSQWDAIGEIILLTMWKVAVPIVGNLGDIPGWIQRQRMLSTRKKITRQNSRG